MCSRKALLLLLAALVLPMGAHAQSDPQSEPQPEPAPEAAAEPAAAPASLTEEDFSKPMGPADPLNRGTPRGSMYGFITAAREGDYERAAEFLDLRRLPPAERGDGPQLARQLKAVLDQKLWVDFATLSDSNDGVIEDGLPDWQDRVGEIETRDGQLTILLQRVPREEDRVQIWKVAATTVARIPELYEEFGPAWVETLLPPVFFEVVLGNLALWQWAGLVVAALAGWLVSLLLAGTLIQLLALLGRRGERLDRRIVRVVRGPVRLALTVLVFSLLWRQLALDPSTQQSLRVIERLLLVVAAALFTFRMIDVGILNLRARAEERGNVALLPVMTPLQRIAKLVVVLIGVLGVLGTLGVNITAAVAGLGVGGIAVALAAQKTIENLFGGATLFADRPVRVGDFFRYGDQVGTVEEIGLRSTRIRTLDRTLVSIPNAEFSSLRLENFAHRDRIRLFAMIGVRYETTPDQLRYVLARLREILLAHPRVTPDPSRVRFVGFGAYSLDLEVFAYVDTSDWNEFLAIREELYLEFMEAIKEAGTGFAFPSTTTYVGRDDGLDDEEVRRAEARVAEWREKGKLPFPSFDESFRRERENTTPWPPLGSPDAASKAIRGDAAD